MRAAATAANMSPNTFYRLAIWLPLVVPGVVALLVHGAGYRPDPVFRLPVQLMLMSLLYGGVPYAAVALWALFWIDDRPEPELRRMALRAPLLLAGAFMALAGYVGLRSGDLQMFAAFSALGIVMSIAIGYAWVGVTFVLRQALGRAGVVVPRAT